MQINKRIYIQEDKANGCYYLYVDAQEVARFYSLEKALASARVWNIIID